MSKLTETVGKVRQFLAEVRNELHKSAWPTRGELLESTAVVILSVILFSVFVGITDTVLVKVVGLIVR
jgi:preprotein translocase subunit SecE